MSAYRNDQSSSVGGPAPQPQPSRRQFLRGAGAGLVLGLTFGTRLKAQVVDLDAPPPADFEPNAFLRISPDGSVEVIAKHDEMGQGIHTGIAIVLCEELEVDVRTVSVVPAPADPAYANSAYFVQVTGGSTSTWSSFPQLREAGAKARMMLMAAAAKRWGVAAGDCRAENGSVVHPDGQQRLGYGDLVADAGQMPVPEEAVLKDPKDFKQIGKPTPRLDSAEKVRGTAVFSLDRHKPGMLTAQVARCPYFGGELKSVDDAAAKAVPGVKAVVKVPSGVAVIADGYWAAFKARAALKLSWTPGPDGLLDTEEMRREYTRLSGEKGMDARTDGDPMGALEDSDKTIEAVYEVPFQAHAPMEPLSCMVELKDDGGADIVTGSQMLGGDHPATAARLGVDKDKVTFTNSLLGGGFGRRANPKSDFTLEAVEVALAAKEQGIQAPIKTVWSREDDLKGGWYRPMFINRVKAGLKDGNVHAWHHRVVGQSIAAGTAFENAMVVNGVDVASVEGVSDMPHGIPNLGVELHTVKSAIPVQWWRSVGHSHTAFAKESFLDECAEALDRDPYELRRELLKGHPRWLRVLDLAAEKGGWKYPLPKGHGRGIAVHESFKGFAAHVVEASVENGMPRIHRITVAIDCGLAVNPDQVVAQMQGAAIFSLSATLGSEITFKDGKVEQSNFHDFQVVRMDQAPSVTVHVVPSNDEMGGIGEVGVPGVPSAVCSALYQACGKRIRRLPIGNQLKG